MNPSMDDVQVVLDRFDASDWDELRIDAGDFHLHAFKSPRSERPARAAVAAAPAAISDMAAAPVAAATPGPATQAPTASPAPSTDGVVVRAPSLGTFYRSPKPGAAPYVEVGDEVDTDTQLCLLEVMKLYTAVAAGVSGVVAEILVEDGTLVEHDQALFVIRPSNA